MREYDVVVIGSGTSGQTVSAACAQAGRSVAVVDRLPFGGTCALRGCQPKKVLLSGAEAAASAAALQGRGLNGSCAIDWPTLMQRKRALTDPIPENTVSWMRAAGIDTLQATARFVAPDTLDVGGEQVRAAHVVIATGAKPLGLGIEGESHLLTSTDFLDLDEMPAEIALVGGGYISFEFARLAQLAGAKVTIIHGSGQVLAGFDPVLANQLAERYRMLGIDLWLDAPVQRIERTAGERTTLVTPRGALEVDAAFHGAGRVPELDDLDLGTGAVAFGRRGVTVDEHLRSVSNPRVYAAGDAAAAGAPLTPVAGAQGEVVAANILGTPTVFDGSVTASVVFTDPPLARVGIDAQEVEGDARYEVVTFDMSGWFTQTRVGNTAAGARLVIERDSQAIRGAHLLSVSADEVINLFALAVSAGTTVENLKTMTWSYPTLAYDINYLTGRY